MDSKEIRRNRAKEDARRRRRKRRKKVLMIERIVVALILIGGVAGVFFLIKNIVPEIQLARQLEAAGNYIEAQAYDDAIASCEEALEIDSSSVQAYSAMAKAYLTKEDTLAAEQILYQGWEITQDESLLQYYCTVLLNEAVADINAQNCTFETLERCISVLEKDPDNADAFHLINVCYERLFGEDGELTGLLCSVSVEDDCGYKRYQDMMHRLLFIYEETPTEELQTEILKFAVPGTNSFWMDVMHLTEYGDLIERVSKVGSNEQIVQIASCIDKAKEVQDFFKEAFDIFESGEFAPIKEFMNKQEYISLRDQFISGTMEYWYGATYIPVSREKMQFINVNGSWMFAFAGYEECENSVGVINVWGVKQEDAGVQRLCISYEPAAETGEYYPHTTYEFIYLYSNVEVRKNNYVPQMNYRFETRVATPEGTTTQLIGDWGGEHEWTTEF